VLALAGRQNFVDALCYTDKIGVVAANGQSASDVERDR
jgi:hypothetical protein